MKKIISFSLWGDKPIYNIGAIRNAEIAKVIYPDWICRFYVGKSTPIETINELRNFDNTEIIQMDEQGDWTGMFWRFYPASEEDVKVMISRDCDSRLSKREVMAVNEWINSDKDFHIMRDHPHHNIEILGGMWGVKNNLLYNMKSLINDYLKGDFWQVDQNFLKEIIYPIIKGNVMVHDEFFSKIPFPTVRNNNEFVGDVFDENDKRHPEYFKFLM
jgi:protein O-GlcNAc transferase